ncbi:extracellular solute-binding protein [Ruania alba]|uniref:Carbohydrate ABC transporter substrate-binding protein, CUT1 family n=1 Tax=Ruania alba TaxID=648782 RepID=A0A1H5DDN8_9MICO|nr:extracellular solute-binding protein [Ruania alba]SED76939.1 carbohydrate ABC transporter substrate-binding protein, CUT1 family [Ruania alba]
MKTRIGALGAFTTAALLLAGCSGGTTSADAGGGGGEDVAAGINAVTGEQLDGTNIQFAHFFGNCEDEVGDNVDLANAVGECATLTTLMNQFNAENEFGITVERLGGAAWDSFYDQLNTAIAGGTPPDVTVMHGQTLPDYAQRNLLLPLDDVTETANIELDDALPVEQEAVQSEGTTYAVPFDYHAALAHVNVDIFAEAGLVDADGNPQLPTTEEEFLAAAATVKEATGKEFIAIPRVGDNLGWHFVNSMVMQQGSSILSEDLSAGNLDSPEVRTGIEFVNALVEGGYTDGNQTYDSANQSFINGEVAMMYNGTWVVNTLVETAPFDYQAHTFPNLYGEPNGWANQHTWAIPLQQDQDPVKYRAALEFISFLYDNNAAWALGTGHIAARTSVLESPEYQDAPQRSNYASTAADATETLPHIQNWPAVETVSVQAVESIWFQDTEIADALANGNSQITSTLEGQNS